MIGKIFSRLSIVIVAILITVGVFQTFGGEKRIKKVNDSATLVSRTVFTETTPVANVSSSELSCESLEDKTRLSGLELKQLLEKVGFREESFDNS